MLALLCRPKRIRDRRSRRDCILDDWGAGSVNCVTLGALQFAITQVNRRNISHIDLIGLTNHCGIINLREQRQAPPPCAIRVTG